MEIAKGATRLSEADLDLIKGLRPTQGSVLAELTSGLSGATVLLLDLSDKRDGPQGPHILKLQTLKPGVGEPERHERAKATVLGDRIPDLVG